MALKSTIYKAELQLSDMDRQVYGEHSLTLALHPSETEERLMMRLLMFALNVLGDDSQGQLQFAKGLSDTEEPDLWHKDYAGQILHWIEVGQPDERRLSKACSRSEQVTILSYAASTPVWFSGLQNKITRLKGLRIWQLPTEQSQALASLAQRSMRLQATIQDGLVWISEGERTLELRPSLLHESH